MIRKVWKIKQGNTAIIEAAADALVNSFKKEKFKVQFIESQKGFIFAQKSKNRVDLYSFGQYESKLLPTNLLAEFLSMIPEETVLDRPAHKPKPRDYDYKSK